MAAAGFFFQCHSRRSLIAIHSYKCYELTTAAILAELVTEIYAFCGHQLFPCCRIAAMASAASSARARASPSPVPVNAYSPPVKVLELTRRPAILACTGSISRSRWQCPSSLAGSWPRLCCHHSSQCTRCEATTRAARSSAFLALGLHGTGQMCHPCVAAGTTTLAMLRREKSARIRRIPIVLLHSCSAVMVRQMWRALSSQ